MSITNYIAKNIPSAKGKNIIITGANSGIGFEASKILAAKGGNIYLACRNGDKANVAISKIKEEVKDASLNYLHYDQSSFDEINAFVEEIKSKKIRIDILVLNAGVWGSKKGLKTKEGFNYTIGVNYIGVYYLLLQLIPYLNTLDHPRVIFVGSVVEGAQPHYLKENLYGEKGSAMHQYSYSKRAIKKFYYTLANGMNLYNFPERKNIVFLFMHPGVCSSNIIYSKDSRYPKWFQNLGHLFMKCVMMGPKKASLGICYLATRNYLFNGNAVQPRGLFHLSGYPKAFKIKQSVVVGCGEMTHETGLLLESIGKVGQTGVKK